MKIAILTGASSGLGRAFAEKTGEFFPEIEEIWLVARRADRLSELSARIKAPRAVCVPCDLTRDEDIGALADKLRAENADVALLINNAGCGFWGEFADARMGETLMSIDLNVRALTRLTRVALEYMREGARIINTSSIASFSPTPNMAVYSATKAYVTFFSRALNEELKHRRISSTAVCPAPMDTEFLKVGHVTGNSNMFEKLPFVKVDEAARGALKAAQKRKPVYTPRVLYKLYKFLTRVLPDALLIKLAKA